MTIRQPSPGLKTSTNCLNRGVSIRPNPRSSEPSSTPFTPRWRPGGGVTAYCWPAIRRTKRRRFSAKACALGGVIQTTDAEKARQRDHELIANPTMLRPITPLLGPGLHGDAPPPAATRAAQPCLADGTRLDDRVGYHFAVLATHRFIGVLPEASRELFADGDPTLISA